MKPSDIFPIKDLKTTVFLKALVESSEIKNIHIGEYSYYSDFDDPTKFLTKNVLYNYGISGNALIIGKFCAFAHGVRFIMPDANHVISGITTFPFAVFGGEWNNKLPLYEYPLKKMQDTVIGNDVWIGHEATIMPGVHIGSGAIIGTKSVVATDIPPYSIAVGNPAKVIKYRYTENEQEILLNLAWWDWDIEKIELAIPLLVKGDISELLTFARNQGLC